jgi:hypothetical protein
LRTKKSIDPTARDSAQEELRAHNFLIVGSTVPSFEERNIMVKSVEVCGYNALTRERQIPFATCAGGVGGERRETSVQVARDKDALDDGRAIRRRRDGWKSLVEAH